MPSERPLVSLIAALSRNGVIGRDNAMPWHLPADLKRFKALTLGHPVIMGRKTWDSILATLGKPLPGRSSIVLTRKPGAALPGATVAASMAAAIAAAGTVDEVFVIGGAEIYALALPFAGRLHLTEIDADVEGDTFFPPFSGEAFVETGHEAGPAHAEWRYAFATYERRRQP